MEKMLKIGLILVLMASCQATKKLDLEDKTKTSTETEKKETTRKGDSLTVLRPYNIKYKDTTIYTYSYETKSYIRETYDKEGNQKIDCVTDEIRELIETNRTLIENDIRNREEKEVSFDPASLIWAIAGLGIVVVLLAIVGMVFMARLQKAMPGMVAEAVKQALDKQ